MVWIALGCGFALGCAQFFLLKALIAQALSGRQRRLPLLLAAKLAVYLAAALAAVYLLGDALLYAGVGLLAGLAGLALVLGFVGLRRAAADPPPDPKPKRGEKE